MSKNEMLEKLQRMRVELDEMFDEIEDEKTLELLDQAYRYVLKTKISLKHSK